MRSHKLYMVIGIGIMTLISDFSLAGTPVRAPKDRRTFALGSGGTNYSKLRKDRNGLYRSIYNGSHVFWGAWCDGAFSSIYNNFKGYQSPVWGSGYSCGLLVEYQKDIFRVQGGGGFRWQEMSGNVMDTTFVNPHVFDSQGYLCTLQYDFYNRNDQAKTTYFDIPISLGVGFYNFYANVGVKFEVPLAGRQRVRANVTTTSTYDQFIGNFEEMDNHGLRKDVPIDYKNNELVFKKSLNTLLSAEIGYEWAFNTGYVGGYNAKNKHFEERLRVALFGEYGFANVLPNSSFPLVYIPEDYKWDVPKYEMNHILTTEAAKGFWAHNYYAGIRIIFLIGIKTSTKCVLCGEYQSEADM